jgi:hypothetical protein
LLLNFQAPRLFEEDRDLLKEVESAYILATGAVAGVPAVEDYEAMEVDLE